MMLVSSFDRILAIFRILDRSWSSIHRALLRLCVIHSRLLMEFHERKLEEIRIGLPSEVDLEEPV